MRVVIFDVEPLEERFRVGVVIGRLGCRELLVFGDI
jgi:hypothetical protein